LLATRKENAKESANAIMCASTTSGLRSVSRMLGGVPGI